MRQPPPPMAAAAARGSGPASKALDRQTEGSAPSLLVEGLTKLVGALVVLGLMLLGCAALFGTLEQAAHESHPSPLVAALGTAGLGIIGFVILVAVGWAAIAKIRKSWLT